LAARVLGLREERLLDFVAVSDLFFLLVHKFK